MTPEMNTVVRLGFALMLHSDDDIPLLVPAVDVPVRLDHLFQPIGPIDNWLQGARLGQFLEYDEIRRHRSGKSVVDRDDLAAWRQRALRVHEGARALSPSNGIENHVVALWPAREVLARVDDDGAGAECPHARDAGCTAHAGHL